MTFAHFGIDGGGRRDEPGPRRRSGSAGGHGSPRTGSSSSSSGSSASGYFVNLFVFAISVGPIGAHYIPAAVIAFCVAVSNNFWWNRHWTFDAKHGHAGFQAMRFLTVSVAASINLIALER